MIVRYLTQNDIVEHDKVSSQAFSLPCDIHDPTSVLPSSNMLGAFGDDDKTLFADLEILERTCHYDGGVLTCAAVGGVAAKPEHRGKGAVTALFDRMFRECRYDISILYPFAETYYRKLGYERTGRAVRATVPFSEIAHIPRNQDVTMYEGENASRLLAVYNKCARPYNLCFVRENANAFSGEPYLFKRYTYVWKDNAFATVEVDRENSVLHVKEIYFDAPESMRGILGFLRNFESNQQRICFGKIPADSPLLHYLRDWSRCDLKLYSTGAVRILNVENVLKAHQYPADGAFTLQVGDAVFAVTVFGGRAEVERTDADTPDAVMDIALASRLLLGGFTDAAYIPNLQIHNPDSAFFSLFPPRPVFFSDDF